MEIINYVPHIHAHKVRKFEMLITLINFQRYKFRPQFVEQGLGETFGPKKGKGRGKRGMEKVRKFFCSPNFRIVH
jgi:hypothetical protein